MLEPLNTREKMHFILGILTKPPPCSIVYALSTFSSVFLVTVTVTRKMVTMMLSVVAFGHRLSGMQWLGVVLVFGGVGAEAQITRMEKMAKLAAKKDENTKKEL